MAKSSKSSAAAAARIQKPAGRASSMRRIIASMIAVRDGQNRILAEIATPIPAELVPLPRAYGRVLADDVRAPIDVPPADNSAVDGYAVASADIPELGTRELVVVADLPAGVRVDWAGQFTYYERATGATNTERIAIPTPPGDALWPWIAAGDDGRVAVVWYQRLADELAADGLVKFIDNPRHRRSKLVQLTAKGDARYRELNARFLSIASTMGAALREADIRKTTELVRHLSDDVKARSERLS